MIMDNQIVVQPGTVPPEGTVSPTVVVPLEPTPEEKMARLIEDKVAEAVARSTELARREIQSAKDRATAEVQTALRRATVAERTLSSAHTVVQGLDPDVARAMELAELRAKEDGRQAMEQEEAATRQQLEFHQQFQSNLTQFVTGLGIDPADKRIDWAGDAPNYLNAQQRVLDSVSKIQKENIQTMQSSLEKRLKEVEGKVQQVSNEANSVNTATSGGVVTGSDEEFIKNFASGDIPMTKTNLDRYNKIQQS